MVCGSFICSLETIYDTSVVVKDKWSKALLYSLQGMFIVCLCLFGLSRYWLSVYLKKMNISGQSGKGVCVCVCLSSLQLVFIVIFMSGCTEYIMAVD